MMGFPYTLNEKKNKIGMDDLSDSTRLHLLSRKVNVNKILNKTFITYTSPTAKGEIGSPLMVKRMVSENG
jgi:hypothetical protein